ncbi:hypothetical protein GCM10023067_01390 [Aminobacter aganoensis]
MARGRLPRQGAVGRRRTPALQCAPEAAGSVEAQLEGVIERQRDGIDVGFGLMAVENKVVRAIGGPAREGSANVGRALDVAGVGKIDGRRPRGIRIGQPGRAQNARKGLL